MKKKREIEVNGISVRVVTVASEDYICLTDMLKSKDGEFFFSDWLRNRNTVEFLGVWERVNNPDFNYGEFAIIKSQAGLNSYKLSAKEWMEKTHAMPAAAFEAAERNRHSPDEGAFVGHGWAESAEIMTNVV